MFRETRMKTNITSKEEAEEMLREAANGVLAVEGDGGVPLYCASKLCL